MLTQRYLITVQGTISGDISHRFYFGHLIDPTVIYYVQNNLTFHNVKYNNKQIVWSDFENSHRRSHHGVWGVVVTIKLY